MDRRGLSGADGMERADTSRDVANLIVRPNRGPNFSAASYAEKTARWKVLWQKITVLPAE
jgi:hypothetical protein